MLSTIVSAVKTAVPYIKMGARGFILVLGVLNALAAVVTALLPYIPDTKPKVKARKLTPTPEPAAEVEEPQIVEVAELSEYSEPEAMFARLN